MGLERIKEWALPEIPKLKHPLTIDLKVKELTDMVSKLRDFSRYHYQEHVEEAVDRIEDFENLGFTSATIANLTVTTNLTLSALTASKPVFTGASKILTSSGTSPVDQGGTGQITYINGQLLIGNTTGNTLTKATLTAGTDIAISNGTGSISIGVDSTVGTQWDTAYSHSQIAGGDSVHVSTTENTQWDSAYSHSQIVGGNSVHVSTTENTQWDTAYTHSQIAGGNSVHVGTTENTNWDTAYTHSQDNTQAHSDYLLNNTNDATTGSLTAIDLFITDNGNDPAIQVGDDGSNYLNLQWDSGSDFGRVQTWVGGSADGDLVLQGGGGNVGIGTSTFDASAVKSFVISSASGTAPAASLTDSVQLYATDRAAGYSQLYYRAEGGQNRPMSNWHNVQDYGAKGDNSNDDTTAIQAAIASSSAGDVIYFPSTGGVGYKITGTIDIAINRLTFRGDGRGSQLNFTVAGTDNMFESSIGTDDVRFYDLSFYQTNTTAAVTGFYFTSDDSRITWADCNIEGFTEYGIELASIQSGVIRRTKFLNIGHLSGVRGIAIRTTTFANHFTVDTCSFHDCDQVISIETSGAAVNFTNCSIESSGHTADGASYTLGYPMNFEGCFVVRVVGNYIEATHTGATHSICRFYQCRSPSFKSNYVNEEHGQAYSIIKGDGCIGRISVRNNDLIDPTTYFVDTDTLTNCHENRYEFGADLLNDNTNPYDDIMNRMNDDAKIELDLPYITTSWNQASIADNAFGGKVLADVKGAALGDQVIVSIATDNLGLNMYGAVTLSDKVEIGIVNNTGAAADMADSTGYVRIFKV